MNLGKTITLPGSSEALDVASCACAKFGIASPRTTVSNTKKPAPFITTFMIASLSRHPGVNGLTFGGRPTLSRCAGIRATPALARGPEVEIAQLLEQRRARYAKKFRVLLDAPAGACKRSADVVALGPIANLREGRKRRLARLRCFGGKQCLDGDPWRQRE